MGLASFNRMRLNQVEEMKPENIMKRKEEEVRASKPTPSEKEVKTEELKKEEVKITEDEETPRRRNTRRHT